LGGQVRHEIGAQGGEDAHPGPGRGRGQLVDKAVPDGRVGKPEDLLQLIDEEQQLGPVRRPGQRLLQGPREAGGGREQRRQAAGLPATALEPVGQGAGQGDQGVVPQFHGGEADPAPVLGARERIAGQPRQEPGPDERGLAGARGPDHRETAAGGLGQEPDQVIGLGTAPAKDRRVGRAQCVQAGIRGAVPGGRGRGRRGGAAPQGGRGREPAGRQRRQVGLQALGQVVGRVVVGPGAPRAAVGVREVGEERLHRLPLRPGLFIVRVIEGGRRYPALAVDEDRGGAVGRGAGHGVQVLPLGAGAVGLAVGLGLPVRIERGAQAPAQDDDHEVALARARAAGGQGLLGVHGGEQGGAAAGLVPGDEVDQQAPPQPGQARELLDQFGGKTALVGHVTGGGEEDPQARQVRLGVRGLNGGLPGRRCRAAIGGAPAVDAPQQALEFLAIESAAQVDPGAAGEKQRQFGLRRRTGQQDRDHRPPLAHGAAQQGLRLLVFPGAQTVGPDQDRPGGRAGDAVGEQRLPVAARDQLLLVEPDAHPGRGEARDQGPHGGLVLAVVGEEAVEVHGSGSSGGIPDSRSVIFTPSARAGKAALSPGARRLTTECLISGLEDLQYQPRATGVARHVDQIVPVAPHPEGRACALRGRGFLLDAHAYPGVALDRQQRAPGFGQVADLHMLDQDSSHGLLPSVAMVARSRWASSSS